MYILSLKKHFRKISYFSTTGISIRLKYVLVKASLSRKALVGLLLRSISVNHSLIRDDLRTHKCHTKYLNRTE